MSVPWYLMAKGKGGGGYKTASGPIVSVSDALAAPLRSLLVNIEPVQDLHGYDSPWPAGGGKNLLPFEDVLADGWTNTQGGITATYSKGYMTVTGTNTTGDYVKIAPFRDAWYGSRYEFGAGTYAMPYHLTVTMSIDGSSDQNETNTITASTGISVRGFYVAVKNGETVNWNIPMVFVRGSTIPTTFAPYSNICPISGWSAVNVWVKPAYDPTANPTATIQLGQTVYGATLDVTNGVLTVTMAMVDMGTLNYSAGFSGFYTLGIKDDIKVPTTVAQSGLKSDIYVVGNTVNADNMYIQFTGAYVGWVVFLPSATYSTPADFKTAMNGHQLVYPLATPITIPLTPTEISTLQGQNNVWADTGDVRIEYRVAGGVDPDLMKLAVAFMGRR